MEKKGGLDDHLSHALEEAQNTSLTYTWLPFKYKGGVGGVIISFFVYIAKMIVFFDSFLLGFFSLYSHPTVTPILIRLDRRSGVKKIDLFFSFARFFLGFPPLFGSFHAEDVDTHVFDVLGDRLSFGTF